MTKTLKLLYILDETAIKETGAPITWLDYKVWKMGPVAIDIYNEIKGREVVCYQGKEITIDEYVNFELIQKEEKEDVIFIRPKSDFNKSIFNKYELDLLAKIEFRFGNWTAQDLIRFLHEEGSLWHKAVKEHNLEERFEAGRSITNYSIEFSELIEHDPILSMANEAALEAMQFQQRLSEYGQER